MTDVKSSSSLSEEVLTLLPEYIQTFFTNPYNEKFMTPFIIGSNKLVLYGYPLIMSEKSELIKSLLDKDPPYILLNFGVVLEKPIIIIWLYLNKIPSAYESLNKLSMNLPEHFQFSRLLNYLGIPLDEYGLYYVWSTGFISELEKDISEEDKKVIIQNKSSLIDILNRFSVLPSEAGNQLNKIDPGIIKLLTYISVYTNIDKRITFIGYLNKKLIEEDKKEEENNKAIGYKSFFTRTTKLKEGMKKLGFTYNYADKVSGNGITDGTVEVTDEIITVKGYNEPLMPY